MNLVQSDQVWMQHAYQLALRAQSQAEVPVGAVLVLNNQIIGEGWNQPISLVDPTAHAEMLALRAGAKTINNYRLIDSTLYVTLEPCLMCAGAIVHARIKRLVYAAADAKAGAIVSIANTLDIPALNHRPACTAGVYAEKCSALLKEFFKQRR